MPKGPKGQKRAADVVGNAVRIMEISLYMVWYNFVKQLRSLKGINPATATGTSDRLRSMEDIAALVDAAAPRPGPRGQYKKAQRSAA